MLELRKNLTSYKSPVIRILVSILVLVLVFYREDLLPSQSELIINVGTGVCAVLICWKILVIYISLMEVYYVFKKKHPSKTKKVKMTRDIHIEKIKTLLRENDIIELEILCNGKRITVGASSDCHHNSKVYFDKKYYIGSVQFGSLEDFMTELTSEYCDQTCVVISIDGCDAKHYKLKE